MDHQAVLEAMKVTKVTARELISRSLPVPDAVLHNHQKIFRNLCLVQKEKRARVSIFSIQPLKFVMGS